MNGNLRFDGWNRPKKPNAFDEAWDSLFGKLTDSQVDELGRADCERVAGSFADYNTRLTELSAHPLDRKRHQATVDSGKHAKRLLRELLASVER